MAMSRSAAPLTAADYIRLINNRTAKILALVLVLSFTVYHGLLHLSYGVTPCKGLFVDGMFKGELWQPWGCMMHKYSQSDIDRCFRYNAFFGNRNHFVFVGDSRVRQIFHSMKNLLTDGSEPTPYEKEVPIHSDLSHEHPVQNLKLDFFWAPTLDENFLKVVRQLEDGPPPSILVLGAATHTIKDSNDSAIALLQYKHNLTRMRPDLEYLAREHGTEVLWMIQPQVFTQALGITRQMITPSAIDRYNVAGQSALGDSEWIHLWSSIPSLCQENLDHMDDGLHMPVKALKHAGLMLLNRHCNDNMNFDDGTCCKSSNKPTNLQIIFFSLVGSCVAVSAFRLFRSLLLFAHSHRDRSNSYNLHHHRLISTGDEEEDGDNEDYWDDEVKVVVNRKRHQQHPLTSRWRYVFDLLTASAHAQGTPTTSPTAGGESGAVSSFFITSDFLFAFTKLGLILTYFYVCDRTNYFMKENKYFTPLHFFLPVLYVFVVGIFFHEETKSAKFLNREQTDEWKGWMQLVILIYHMTGASQVLPIYMHVRVLVSSYIFLNGYGHFFYTWLKGDTSLYRFFQVLFRMNFLTLCLCLAMNEPYQGYYFVPLISFWFSVQYALMAFPPKVTAKATEGAAIYSFYLLVKIIVVLGIISLFYISEVFFEKVFLTRPWKALFVSADDDIREWWFRWKLDRYSMLFGFVFAFVTAVGDLFKLFDDSTSGCLWPQPIGSLVGVSSVAGLFGYFLFAIYCKSKEECNEVHPYVAFIPIVSFVLLRNLYGFLRTRYSSFFAWFGRISLELFISQYHIWLAADTHGVLVLIPNYPVLNILLTSFIFVCAAHEINVVTATLVPYFVPKDYKLMLRNLIIFCLCLIPIGVSGGML